MSDIHLDAFNVITQQLDGEFLNIGVVATLMAMDLDLHEYNEDYLSEAKELLDLIEQTDDKEEIIDALLSMSFSLLDIL